MKKGDTVELIHSGRSQHEADNWSEKAGLQVKGRYIVKEFIECASSDDIMLEGYKYFHDAGKFRIVSHASVSEEVKIHLKAYTDFLLKEGYCDTDVYSEAPTAIDQYLSLNR